jgi:hypothetical protein
MMTRATIVEALRNRLLINTSGFLGDLGLLHMIYNSLSPTYQERVSGWTQMVLGDLSKNVPERALRVAEEVIELAQACGVDRSSVHRLVDYVFDRPVGEPHKEIAGSMLTLYAAAEALGVDADTEFEIEMTRVQQPEVIERVRRRQQEKREALVAADK